MIIRFKTTKLLQDCNSRQRAIRRWGPEGGERVIRRLQELGDADNLDVIRTLPQARCHELKGNRKGQLSVDVKHPLRLIFQPSLAPAPIKPDGGLDWRRVTAIMIIGVEDTHE